MATIVIDDPDAIENGNQPAQQGVAQVTNPEASPTPPPQGDNAEEDDVPEKFRGKKLKEILESYEQMEKLVGRQGQELGELRRTHDEVIRSFLPPRGNSQQQHPQESADDDTEFFVNPKKAIDKAVENHPLVRELRQTQSLAAKDKALSELSSKHADWRDVMVTPEFGEFVRTNPIHVRLMQQADQNYDVAAADYVLSQFKAARAARATAAPAPAQQPSVDATEAARRAAVSASKVPAGAAAPAGNDSGKKIYRRQDLVRKMQTDPEWYAANADEVYAAYAEGRVR